MYVCSTHVEMFPLHLCLDKVDMGLLHACGDVSPSTMAYDGHEASAPRMWRCFLH